MTARRRFGRVRRLPSGRWQARYTTPSGVEAAAPSTFRTKTDAVVFLATMEADIFRGAWRDPGTPAASSTVTVEEWGRRWLDAHPRLKPKTRASYESLLRTRIAPSLGDRRPEDLGRMAVQEWVTAMDRQGLSASRVRQAHGLLSQVLDAVVAEDLLAANPCTRVRLPRLPAHEPTILSTEQVADLRAVMREPYGLLVDCLAYGGLRVGEVLALRRRSVDVAGHRLRVTESLSEVCGRHEFDRPKSHQEREVTLPGFLLDDLRAHLLGVAPAGPEALLFTSDSGGPVFYTTLRRNHWDPACRALGWTEPAPTARDPDRVRSSVTPHDLRASCGSWVAEQHGVLEAARRLGHSTASVTTRHYARALPGGDLKVAEALAGRRRLVTDRAAVAAASG